MDALMPSLIDNQQPLGGAQPRAMMSDLVRPITTLNPFAVPEQQSQFNPGMTTIGLPQAGPRQTVASLSAAVPMSAGAGADVAMGPSGPTQSQVLAEQLPGTLQKVFGGGQQEPGQPKPILGEFMNKIGGAAKSMFEPPRVNLAASSSASGPAGDLSYQTPFFTIRGSTTSGPTGENSTKSDMGSHWWEGIFG